MKQRSAAVRQVKAPWSDVLVAVCGTCDGDAKSVRRRLKAELAARGEQRRVRVVRTSCQAICPKRAVVVTAAPRGAVSRTFVVRDGTAPEAVLAAIVGSLAVAHASGAGGDGAAVPEAGAATARRDGPATSQGGCA